MSESLEMVRRIDFDRLDMLVSERLAALKEYAGRVATAGNSATHDAICRDLILPSVAHLMAFVDSVTIEVAEDE